MTSNQTVADDIVAQFAANEAKRRNRTHRYEEGDQFHAIIDGEVRPFRCLDDVGSAIYAEADDNHRTRRHVDAALIVADEDLLATWETRLTRLGDWMFLDFEGVRYLSDEHGNSVRLVGYVAADCARDDRLVVLGHCTRDEHGALHAVTS